MFWEKKTMNSFHEVFQHHWLIINLQNFHFPLSSWQWHFDMATQIHNWNTDNFSSVHSAIVWLSCTVLLVVHSGTITLAVYSEFPIPPQISLLILIKPRSESKYDFGLQAVQKVRNLINKLFNGSYHFMVGTLLKLTLRIYSKTRERFSWKIETSGPRASSLWNIELQTTQWNSLPKRLQFAQDIISFRNLTDNMPKFIDLFTEYDHWNHLKAHTECT